MMAAIAHDAQGAAREALERRLAANVVKLERLMETSSGYINRMNAVKAAVLADGRRLGHSEDELEDLILKAYQELLE